MDRPDAYCWIKLINGATGRVIQPGGSVNAPGEVVIRYVVANDSHVKVEHKHVEGTVLRGGVHFVTGGIAADNIGVEPDELWKFERTVSKIGDYVVDFKVVRGQGQGLPAPQEDGSNDTAHTSFSIILDEAPA